MEAIDEENYVIVGGGIAGMMTALKLLEQYKKSHPGLTPTITVIDSEKEVASALSSGNGGSLRADEFGVIDLHSPEDYWHKLITPVEEGGLMIPGMFSAPPPDHMPSSVPPCQNPRVQAYLQAQLDYAHNSDQVRSHNALMMEMGFAAMQEWEEFRHEYPEIVKKAGYRPAIGGEGAEKPVIIMTNDAQGDAQALLHQFTRNGKELARSLNPDELIQTVPQLTEFLTKQEAGSSVRAYVMQPGGAINPKVLVTEIKHHLEKELGKKFNFIGDKRVTGLTFSHNNPNNVTAVQLADGKTVGEHTSKFVLTAGANHRLAESLGITVPPAMGYAGASITIPIPEAYKATFSDMSPLVFQTNHGAPVMSVLKDPSNGSLSLRVGGLKAFTGEIVPSIDQPYIKNLLTKEMKMVAQCFPDFMRDVLGKDIAQEGTPIEEEDFKKVHAWTGARPVSFDTRYSIGHPTSAKTGEALENLIYVGHLSSSGIAFSPVIGNVAAQLMVGKDPHDVTIPGINEKSMLDFIDMVSPARKHGVSLDQSRAARN